LLLRGLKLIAQQAHFLRRGFEFHFGFFGSSSSGRDFRGRGAGRRRRVFLARSLLQSRQLAFHEGQFPLGGATVGFCFHERTF
jgi:hypothetical protein